MLVQKFIKTSKDLTVFLRNRLKSVCKLPIFVFPTGKNYFSNWILGIFQLGVVLYPLCFNTEIEVLADDINQEKSVANTQ